MPVRPARPISLLVVLLAIAAARPGRAAPPDQPAASWSAEPRAPLWNPQSPRTAAYDPGDALFDERWRPLHDVSFETTLQAPGGVDEPLVPELLDDMGPPGGVTESKPGFFQRLSITTTWLPRNGDDGFGLTDFTTHMTLALPAPKSLSGIRASRSRLWQGNPSANPAVQVTALVA